MRRITAILCLAMIFTPVWAQDDNADDPDSPELIIIQSDSLEYKRPARLLEKDHNKGREFRFKPGLEIITDVEYVKVYIRDQEAGRTPFESSSVPTGYLRVRLEKPGYEDFSFWVNVHPDRRTTVTVKYNKDSSDSDDDEETGIPPKSRALYNEINPEDPSYYSHLYFMIEEDLNPVESIVISRAGQSLVTLLPHPYPAGAVFRWDGHDASGDAVPDGDYNLQIKPVENMPFRINRNYSRRPLSYFSGFSGLTLAPTAVNLFPGGFQFGSIFAVDRVYEDDSHSYNLPFSFFFRLSPIRRWEACAEVETAFINEYKRPSLRINTSHKVSLLDDTPVKVAIGLRGSYKSAISDLELIQGGTLVRDPGGFSLFVPMQIRHMLWDFYLSPEFLYSVRPLGNIVDEDYDMTSVLRWGVSYGTTQFSVSLSSSLFLPSYRGTDPILQGALDASYYFPDSPMYMSIFAIYQSGFKDDDKSNSFGFNLGFLL